MTKVEITRAISLSSIENRNTKYELALAIYRVWEASNDLDEKTKHRIFLALGSVL